MPAVTRLGDLCSGHGDFPPRALITASSNVQVNGIFVGRVTDSYASHCNPDSCHTGAISAGSPNVFVNNLAVGRISDPVDCGSTVAEGSGNVFIN